MSRPTNRSEQLERRDPDSRKFVAVEKRRAAAEAEFQTYYEQGGTEPADDVWRRIVRTWGVLGLAVPEMEPEVES